MGPGTWWDWTVSRAGGGVQRDRGVGRGRAAGWAVSAWVVGRRALRLGSRFGVSMWGLERGDWAVGLGQWAVRCVGLWPLALSIGAWCVVRDGAWYVW